jgi:aryl-alcohol dehydrogenase-like predicted oxidoreductase
MADDPFEVVDSTGLTDADWAKINKIQEAYREGGKPALNKALAALAKDPIRFAAVIGAFFPEMIREAIKDAVADAGMTEEDLREMARSLESPARNQ